MNVADVLERAADVIVERGWWQGPGEVTDSVGDCAWTAIDTVAPTWADLYRAGCLFADYLNPRHRRRAWPDPVVVVTDWNDDPSRTADEVITALRECAAAERAKS